MRLTEKIEADDNSPQHYHLMQQEKEHLINLRLREIQMEEIQIGEIQIVEIQIVEIQIVEILRE